MRSLSKFALLLCLTGLSSPSMADESRTSKTELDQHKDAEHKHRKGPPKFEELDLDNDQQITLEEFIQHKLPHGEPSEVFVRIDADQDGFISEQELASHKPPRKRKKRHHCEC